MEDKESWFADHFGREHVAAYAFLFHLPLGRTEQVFTRQNGKVVQLLPLELKDKALEGQLLDFLLAMEAHKLPGKPRLKTLPLGASLAVIQERLRLRLKDAKRNMIRGLGNAHLHEIRPLTQEQRAMIPYLAIKLPLGKQINVELRLRQRERPYASVRAPLALAASFEPQVQELRRMARRMELVQKRKTPDLSCWPKRKIAVEVLGDLISGLGPRRGCPFPQG